MNPEKLHDALNLLDEELIASTGKLRDRKVLPWKRIAAMAACFAVVFVLGVFGYGLTKGPQGAESAGDMLAIGMEENAAELMNDSQVGRDDADQLNIQPIDESDSNRSDVLLMESILVEVTAVEHDSFTARVLVADRFFVEGETVTFQITAATCFVQDQTACNMPDASSLFSAGAVLKVDYGFGESSAVVNAQCISFAE